MNYRDVQKLRTRSTVFVVSELLEDIDVNELISELFIYTDDKDSMKLVKAYEKVILKGKMEENYLAQNLNVFYRDMSRYLKKHNLFKVFAEFAYFIYSNLSKEDSLNENNQALNIYQNILLQQYEYLGGENKIVYGVRSDGRLMTRNQLFPCSDYPAYEIERNRIKDPAKIKRVFKRYGYTDKMIENMETVVKDDGLIENMTFAMVNFINEDTEDVLPKAYMLASENTDICNILMYEDIQEIKKKLKKRKYMLPTEGILGLYKNAGDVKSVFFKEVFQNDKMYLLYTLTNKDDEGMYGVYDLRDNFFYSLYKDTSIEGKSHNNIEKFILKSYLMLTTDSEESDDLMEVKNIEELKEDYLFTPVVEFLYEEKDKKGNSKGRRSFDKRNYKESTVSINPYIRRLPAGATASDEAIERAKSFGYELGKGETFVSPFSRRTFRKKD